MTITATAWAISSAEVNTLAKNITLRIKGTTSSGSGVLVQKQGNIYTLLTAAHVLSSNESFQAMTADGQNYPLITTSIRKHPNADLAIAQFSSPKAYSVVTIGNPASTVEGAPSYVAGYPARTEALTESIYNFSTGQITAKAPRPFRDGYGLVYTNTTLPGMSGGPVLNANGQLIGIHGRADAQAQWQDEQLNSKIYVKSGVNLGIPVETAFSLLPKEKLTVAAPNTPSANTPPVATRPTVNKMLLDDLFRQSSFRRRQNDLPGAIAALDQVIRMDPGNIDAYMERGDIYMTLREYLAAAVDFDQVIQLNPELGEAYYNRGIAYLRSGSPKESLASFQIAAEKFKAKGQSEKYKAAREQIKLFR
jgi:serine protease Do